MKLSNIIVIPFAQQLYIIIERKNYTTNSLTICINIKPHKRQSYKKQLDKFMKPITETYDYYDIACTIINKILDINGQLIIQLYWEYLYELFKLL